eukprot:219799_1
MSTLNSFLSHVCCIVIFTNLDTWCTSSAINTYPNEICSPDNWMVIQGDWSFNNTLGSCTITNDMSGNNIAILPYKSWTYLNTVQDPTYQIEIEYNFTITAASANNTIGSVGVIWFPDSDPKKQHDYMGVSFKLNEAFAVATTGLDPDPYYNNMNSRISSDGGEFVTLWYNDGALPLTLSVNTLYSLRMEIYSITERYAKHDLFINNRKTLSQERTYTTEPEHNTSWIGLKSCNASVISHSLTVHQTSNPDSGDSVIRYFTWTGTTTSTPQTSQSADIDTSITTSVASKSTTSVSDTLFSTIYILNESVAVSEPLDVIMLLVILSGVVLCLCCCCAVIVLLCIPNKKGKEGKNDTHDAIEQDQFAIGVQREGEPALIIPSLAATISDVHPPGHTTIREAMSTSILSKDITTNGGEQTDGENYGLKRMFTPDGEMNRDVYCGVCDVVIDKERLLIVDGVKHCRDCHAFKLNKQESLTNEKVYDNGEDMYKANNTFKETLTSKGNAKKRSLKGRIDICEDCGESRRGRSDRYGSFFCSECWKVYVHEPHANSTKGFIQ